MWSSSKPLATAALICGLLAALIPLSGCRREPARTSGRAEISLIDLFDRAERSSRSKSLAPETVLNQRTVKLEGRERRVIHQHPAGTLRYRLRIPRDAVLRFGCCMATHTWRRSPDGVRFHLRAYRVRESGRATRPTTLFTLALNPKNNLGHRRIFRQQVDLGDLGGEVWELVFTLSHGPRKNVKWDDALWVEPRIEYPSGEVELPLTDPARPDILLVTIDSLRADVLASFADPRVDGPALAAAPVIAGLAAEGFRAPATYTPSTLTAPSYYSILTGTSPRGHGAHRENDRSELTRPTAGERFAEQGYRTAAFIGSSSLSGRRSGLHRGFETYDCPATGWRSAEETILGLLDWIRRGDGRPSFCWLQLNELQPPLAHLRDRDRHYYPLGGYNRWDESIIRLLPHFQRRLDLKQRWYRWLHDVTTIGYVEASYLGQVDHLDRQLGRVIDELRARSQLDNTVVVLSANRGLALGDHGIFFTSESLQPGVTRVPLIIRAPGRVPTHRLSERAVCTTADILPTLLGLLPAGDQPTTIQPNAGIDLLAALRRPGLLEERVTFLEGHIGPPGLPNRFALLADGLKLVESVSPFIGSRPGADGAIPWSSDSDYHNRQLFRLLEDPAEARNIHGSRPLADIQQQMQNRLRSMIQPPSAE